MYVQKVKKFIHSIDMPTYISQCMHQQRYWFNYNYMFSAMIKSPRVDVDFLPYGRQFGDPFERLMALPGWLKDFQGEWLPSVNRELNDQPGVKGVYLALNVSRRLKSMGIDLSGFRNRARYIRRHLSPLGWGSDRYFGLRDEDVKRIKEFYKKSNDRFCQKVWQNKSWDSVFGGQKPQQYNVLEESSLSLAEREEISHLIQKVINDLKESNPDSFPGKG